MARLTKEQRRRNIERAKARVRRASPGGTLGGSVTGKAGVKGFRPPPVTTFRDITGRVVSIQLRGKTPQQVQDQHNVKLAFNIQRKEAIKKVGSIRRVERRGGEISFIGVSGKKATFPRAGLKFTGREKFGGIVSAEIPRVKRQKLPPGTKTKEPGFLVKKPLTPARRRALARQAVIFRKPLVAPTLKQKKETQKGFRSAINKFENNLESRLTEAEKVSRQLSRKEFEGKKLTTNEKRARTAAGLQNVGINALIGLSAVPFALTRPKQTGKAIVTTITNPAAVLREMKREITRNPSGFIASSVGVTGALGVAGKVIKTSVKVSAKTIKYSAKAGANTVKGTITASRTGARNVVEVFNKQGRKILTKRRETRYKKGKPLRQLPLEKATRLTKELRGIKASIKSTKELIPKGQKITGIFKKKLDKLESQARNLESRLVRRGQKAARQKQAVLSLALASRQAALLKQEVRKNALRLAKLRKKKQVARRLEKKKVRREKVVSRRRKRKLTGKAARKELRKPFQKRKILRARENIQREARKLSQLKGQITLGQVSKVITFKNNIVVNQLSAVGASNVAQRNIVELFKSMDRAVVKKYKKGKLKGC